jgi:hypothetical protein
VNLLVRLLCVGLALAGAGVLAQTEETYPSLTVGPDTYTNVTILNKTRYDIFFKHSHGMGNVKVRDLDPGTQMRLGYQVDPPKQNKLSQALSVPAFTEMEADPRFQEFEERLVEQGGEILERFDQSVAYSIVAVVVLLYLLWSYLCRCICVKTSNPPSPLIWLPILKQIPMLKAAGMSPWWILSLVLPPVFLVAWILWCFKIVQARGKKAIFALMLILPVTNVIAFFYLALSGDGSERKETRDVINLSDANPPRAAA